MGKMKKKQKKRKRKKKKNRKRRKKRNGIRSKFPVRIFSLHAIHTIDVTFKQI